MLYIFKLVVFKKVFLNSEDTYFFHMCGLTFSQIQSMPKMMPWGNFKVKNEKEKKRMKRIHVVLTQSDIMEARCGRVTEMP